MIVKWRLWILRCFYMSHLIRFYKRFSAQRKCAQSPKLQGCRSCLLLEKNVLSHNNFLVWMFTSLQGYPRIQLDKQTHCLFCLSLPWVSLWMFFIFCAWLVSFSFPNNENLQQESKLPTITRADTIWAQTRTMISCVWRQLCEKNPSLAHLPPRRQYSRPLCCNSVQLCAYDSSNYTHFSLSLVIENT